MLTIFDDSKTGTVNFTGARMVLDENNKGLQGIYSLISAIKFNIIDTVAANGKTVYVKNFKFADIDGVEFTASVSSFTWAAFLKILIGDINLDGVVNSTDFSYFKKVFGKSTAASEYMDADINEDGAINSSDFTVLRNNFGKR